MKMLTIKIIMVRYYYEQGGVATENPIFFQKSHCEGLELS